MSAIHANSTRVALVVHTVDTSGDYVSPGAGSTQVSVKGILSADGSTSLVDSTQNSIGVTIREGSAAGSTLVTVRQSTAADLNVTVAGYSTVMSVSSVGARVFQSTAADLNAAVVQGSTVWPVQVSSVAGVVTAAAVSSSGVSMSTDTTPASTKQGLIVRQVGNTYDSSGALQVNTGPGGSTQVAISSGIVQVQPISSSGVSMSTDTDPASTKQGLIVRQVGFSTIVAVSSVGGVVTVSTGPFQVSSIAGLTLVAQNSTAWNVQAKIQDSSGVGPNIVGTRPSTGAQGIAVRHVLNDLQSTCFSTIGNNSTSATVVSSGAALRHKVYAYSITSTAQAVNTLTFASSLGNPVWHVAMQAFSSGISGANLAVTPPAWLFATEAASPLVFKVTGTTGSYHLSFSYFTEA